MRFETWHLSFVLFPAIVLIHLTVSPYTKVEESFNIQATHDILAFGVPTSNVALKFKALFDHMTFAGAVPRTFIGALILSGVAKPFIWLGELHGEQKQFAVRAVLGCLNASALVTYTYNIRHAYGNVVATCYMLLQVCQFHVLYYASRTLPNMYAFTLSTLALAAMLPSPTSALGPVKRARLSLYLLTLATVIFRSELALLLGSQTLWLLLKSPTMASRASLIRATIIPGVLPAAVAALVMTVGIDTFFWQSNNWLWPEFTAFVSNIFPSAEGLGASAWGTSPWHWYITSALPRLLINPFSLILIPYGLILTTQKTNLLDQLVPSFIYIALYSYLPHKETRFLFPVIPPITLAIAQSATYLLTRRHRLEEIVGKAFMFSLLPTFIVSTFLLLPLSAQGYPGANALLALHQYHGHLNGATFGPQIRVHLTNLALQTGVTKFIEQPVISSFSNGGTPQTDKNQQEEPIILPGSPDGRKPALTYHPKPTGQPSLKSINSQKSLWIYDKSDDENAFLTPDFWTRFDYVVVEDPARVIGAWEIIAEIRGLQRRPRLFHPNDAHERLLPLSSTSAEKNDDGLIELFDVLYGRRAGRYLAHTYALIHDILREGYLFPPARLLTRGYWLTWGLETKLYILRRDYTEIYPNKDQEPAHVSDEHQTVDMPALLPAYASSEHEPMLSFDDRGPLVVNKDGTLSRLRNWEGMTDAEKKRTTEYLKKRNQLRMD